MKKYIYLGFLMVLLVGCATMRYSNEYGDNHVMLAEQYEAIKPGLNWSKTYPEGCSVIDFYERFPEYDEIVNVSITEQINETKLGVLVISKKSFCKYTGIGVKYQK